MKKAIKHLFTLLILSSVLISGNGIVLAIHTCLSTSTKNVSLFKEVSCCKEERSVGCDESPDADCIDAKCCLSEHAYHKLDLPSIPVKAEPLTALIIDIFQPVYQSIIPFSITYTSFYAEHPPRENLPVILGQLLI
jgi:hypothetical protein